MCIRDSLQSAQGAVALLREGAVEGGEEEREEAGGIPGQLLVGIADEESVQHVNWVNPRAVSQRPQRYDALHGVVKHGEVGLGVKFAAQVDEGAIVLLVPLYKGNGALRFG